VRCRTIVVSSVILLDSLFPDRLQRHALDPGQTRSTLVPHLMSDSQDLWMKIF